MAGEDVENDTSGMDVVRQRLGACGFDGLQPIGQDGPEDIHHLPVTAGLAFQLALHASQGDGQVPFPERRAVAQSTGFAR
jgi:hypothetical protein